MQPNPQFPVNLVTFTEKILTRKFLFCAVSVQIQGIYWPEKNWLYHIVFIDQFSPKPLNKVCALKFHFRLDVCPFAQLKRFVSSYFAQKCWYLLTSYFLVRTIGIFRTILSFPVDTGRKLNIHKAFRRRPGRLLNVLCTFNLRPVSTGFLDVWQSI